jgi:hypothetical protein
VGSKKPEPHPTLEPSVDRWSLFCDRLSEVGGEVAEPASVPGYPGPFWVQESLRPLWPGLELASDPWEAETGVCRAELAIAETGSLLFASGPVKPRLLSLLPPRHVVLLDPGRIEAGLESALARLDGRNWAIVTGPSRTADIEGVLVRGVHGPRELIVVPFPE